MLIGKIKPVLLKLEGKESLSGRRFRSSGFWLTRIVVGIFSGWLSYFVAIVVEPKINLKYVCIFLLLVIGFASFYFLSVIKQGEEAWHCCLSNKREPSFRHAIFWLLPINGMKSALLNFVLTTKKLFWYFLFLLPGVILLLLSYLLMNSNERNLSVIILAGGVTSSLIGLLFAFIINQRYFMTKYLVAKCPNKHIKDALNESADLMNGICLRTAIFKSSFFPLFLICLFGLPGIFVFPYFKHSCICLKREIIESSF